MIDIWLGSYLLGERTAMKHKTAELTGAQLDAAVAKACGYPWQINRVASVPDACFASGWRGEGMKEFMPSTSWAHGGPIIERERMDLEYQTEGDAEGEPWEAAWYAGGGAKAVCLSGPTPLIAAMRAFVASRFGYEVELP